MSAPKAFIYTVFEFPAPNPEGVIHYRRHLVAGHSFEEARSTIIARAILQIETKAYMSSQEAVEACRDSVHVCVNTLRDQSMTMDELRRWIKSSTSAHMESGDRIEPSHARIW